MLWVLLKSLWVSVCDEFLSLCHILRGERVSGSPGGTQVLERQAGIVVRAQTWSLTACVRISAPSLTDVVTLRQL